MLINLLRTHRWIRVSLSGLSVVLLLGGLGLRRLSRSSPTSGRAGSRPQLDDQLVSPELQQAYKEGKIETGDSLTRIRIPALDVDVVVVEGITPSALRAGAGHYPNTALPCEGGNVAIAGHRTTYGRPFGNLDQLKAGDKIELITPIGACQYEVAKAPFVTPPDDLSVIAPTGPTRCSPSPPVTPRVRPPSASSSRASGSRTSRPRDRRRLPAPSPADGPHAAGWRAGRRRSFVLVVEAAAPAERRAQQLDVDRTQRRRHLLARRHRHLHRGEPAGPGRREHLRRRPGGVAHRAHRRRARSPRTAVRSGSGCTTGDVSFTWEVPALGLQRALRRHRLGAPTAPCSAWGRPSGSSADARPVPPGRSSPRPPPTSSWQAGDDRSRERVVGPQRRARHPLLRPVPQGPGRRLPAPRLRHQAAGVGTAVVHRHQCRRHQRGRLRLPGLRRPHGLLRRRQVHQDLQGLRPTAPSPSPRRPPPPPTRATPPAGRSPRWPARASTSARSSPARRPPCPRPAPIFLDLPDTGFGETLPFGTLPGDDDVEPGEEDAVLADAPGPPGGRVQAQPAAHPGRRRPHPPGHGRPRPAAQRAHQGRPREAAPRHLRGPGAGGGAGVERGVRSSPPPPTRSRSTPCRSTWPPRSPTAATSGRPRRRRGRAAGLGRVRAGVGPGPAGCARRPRVRPAGAAGVDAAATPDVPCGPSSRVLPAAAPRCSRRRARRRCGLADAAPGAPPWPSAAGLGRVRRRLGLGPVRRPPRARGRPPPRAKARCRSSRSQSPSAPEIESSPRPEPAARAGAAPPRRRRRRRTGRWRPSSSSAPRSPAAEGATAAAPVGGAHQPAGR